MLTMRLILSLVNEVGWELREKMARAWGSLAFFKTSTIQKKNTTGIFHVKKESSLR